MLNLEYFNPDWEMARKHGKASKAGFPPSGSAAGDNTIVCECCYNVVYKDSIPLCSTIKELEFLGFGFPLFYTFLKSCMIMLFVSIASYNILALTKAIDYNYQLCHVHHDTTHDSHDSYDTNDDAHDTHRRMLGGGSSTCETFMVQLSSIQSDVSKDEEVIRIVSFVFTLFYLLYMRDRLRKLSAYYDERNTSLSDYSIMMKKIPKVDHIQEKVRNFFEKGFSQPHEIKQITLLPEYHEIEKLEKKKHEVMKKIRPYDNKQNYEEDDQFIKLDEQLKELTQNIMQEAQKSKSLVRDDEMICERIILVFNTEDEKDKILEEFSSMSKENVAKYFGHGSEHLKIQQAPEPRQILWENVHIPQSKRILLRLLGWGLSLLVLVIVTIAFFFILVAKAQNIIDTLYDLEKDPENEKYKSNYNGAIASVYIMLFVVVLFNKLLMVVLFHKFTDLERHQTTSKFQFSFALKYCLGLFFTTALMTLAVQAIHFENYNAHPYGVIEEETVMYFLNALFVPFFWLVNPFHLIKKFKRYRNQGKRSLTQGEANALMEDTQYEMGKRYAQVIETMWFTYLYATLLPIGAIISLGGLILYYWIDKYNLLRRSSLNTEIYGKLVMTSMALLDFCLVFRPIGELIFDKQVRHQWHASSVAMLVIGFVYLIIPKNYLLDIFNPQHFNSEAKTYLESRETFKHDYHTEHPVLKMLFKDKQVRRLTKRNIFVGDQSETLDRLKHPDL